MKIHLESLNIEETAANSPGITTATVNNNHLASLTGDGGYFNPLSLIRLDVNLTPLYDSILWPIIVNVFLLLLCLLSLAIIYQVLHFLSTAT